MNFSSYNIIQIIRAITDYQFGPDITKALFEKSTISNIDYSKNTGRMKHVYVNDELFLNYRPNVGLFTLSLNAARRI